MNYASLTFDVENDYGTKVKEKTYLGITKGIPVILDMLKDLKLKGTFFCTGEVAKNYPEIIKEISMNHELGCHGGFHHIHSFLLNQSELEKEINKNFRIIEKYGKKPRGFRSVNTWIDKFTMNILEKKGFLYDSSIISPLMYYQFLKYNEPYFPSIDNCRLRGERKILEIPISSLPLPLIRIPHVGTWIKFLGTKPYYFFSRDNDLLIYLLHSFDFVKLPHYYYPPFVRQRIRANSGKDFSKLIEELVISLSNHGHKFLTMEEIAKHYINGVSNK